MLGDKLNPDKHIYVYFSPIFPSGEILPSYFTYTQSCQRFPLLLFILSFFLMISEILLSKLPVNCDNGETPESRLG